MNVERALAAAREARGRAQRFRDFAHVRQYTSADAQRDDALAAHIEALAQRCAELEARLAKRDYVCGVCGGRNWQTCNYPGCPDGR